MCGCPAVRQCAAMLAAVCGSVRRSVQHCAAVCGSVWQCALQCVAVCSAYIHIYDAAHNDILVCPQRGSVPEPHIPCISILTDQYKLLIRE
jgi:hypothetical protein